MWEEQLKNEKKRENTHCVALVFALPRSCGDAGRVNLEKSTLPDVASSARIKHVSRSCNKVLKQNVFRTPRIVGSDNLHVSKTVILAYGN